MHIARIPFGDKSFELPFVLSRVQLTTLAMGGFCALIAFAIGTKLGIAAWLMWPVVLLTLAILVALGFSSAPDRGAGLAAEGYTRMLWTRLPFVSSISSSRSRSESRNAKRTDHITMAMRLHEPPSFTQKRSRH